jgi:hypothetical protein
MLRYPRSHGRGWLMVFKIRYTVRGEWTLVDVIRADVPPDEACHSAGVPLMNVRGRVLFRTYEWAHLFGRLGFKGQVGHAGEREISIP